MRLSRSLLTFAFVADSFQKSGDITSGFDPLFAPVLNKHRGSIFDPTQFAKEVSDTWGVKMHPYVALDLAPKLARHGLLRAVMKDDTVTGYRIIDKGIDYPTVNEDEIVAIVTKFFAFAETRTSNHAVKFSDAELEEALYQRVITMEFLAIIGREQPSYLKSKTLSLTKPEPPPGPTDPEANRQVHLDYLCADFVEHLFHNDQRGFALLADVSCGALLAEVVLGLRTPPATGQDASGLIIYFDAPFIMDLLGLTEFAMKEYADLLFQAAKASNATLRCFTHNIEEIEANIDAPLANLERHAEVFGPTGRLLLQGTAGRAFVLSIRRNVPLAVTRLGIEIEETRSDAIKTGLKYYTLAQEERLGQHLGTYQNVYAKLRDAASIANILRLRGERKLTATVFSSIAIFVTRNPRLANRANSYLVRELRYSEESVPPIVTDRFLSGILWIAQGGKGQDIPRRKLLANCMSAMIPRRDIVTKMYGFLAQVDSQKAAHFEALIANDRCAFYLMEQTLGDRDLVTLDNCQAIYENIERATAEKVILEKDAVIATKDQEHTVALKAVTDQAEQERIRHSDEVEVMRGELTALQSLSNELVQAQAEANVRARAERERAINRCIKSGRTAARTCVIAIATLFALVSVVLTDTISLWGVLGLPVAFVIAVVGFWQMPDLVFTGLLDRFRRYTFRKKADELGVVADPDRLDIDWVMGRLRNFDAGASEPHE